jgi:hypothetical protein
MKTENVLSVLRVLAWILLAGYAINFASQLFRFGWKLFNPLELNEVVSSEADVLWAYVRVMSFVLILSGMFVYLWYLITNLLSGINLSNPFTPEMVKKLEGVAYLLFNIWLVSMISHQVTKSITLSTDTSLDVVQVSTEWLLIAGIVYIISQVYKHGVALQQEQDLTI